MNKEIVKRNYIKLLKDIKQRIHSAQYEALKTVNRELVRLYWDIGQMIVERQKGQNWGKSIVTRLARDLQSEFPGIKGYSTQNLWYMRQFCLTYRDNQKLQPLVGEIGWSHNIIIMSKCKDDLQREFYIRSTRKFGWSKNVLIHQIENQTYEKTLLNQTNFDQTVSESIRNQAKLAVRDDYLFDFLELGERHSERELERAIIAKIERFLRQMGGMFAFLGSQYRLEINNEEYFIDLLLYHRALKCLVAIDLKVGKFIPEHIGKMQFYLAVIDDKVRMAEENSSIGIILCKTKDKTIVEYALRESNKPIGVAEYKIVKTLPDEMKNLLPTSEQIEHLLKEI
jgi:predicted nuclease of restriction endonuclease-like (RecB) superfamily